MRVQLLVLLAALLSFSCGGPLEVSGPFLEYSSSAPIAASIYGIGRTCVRAADCFPGLACTDIIAYERRCEMPRRAAGCPDGTTPLDTATVDFDAAAPAPSNVLHWCARVCVRGNDCAAGQCCAALPGAEGMCGYAVQGFRPPVICRT